jgi:hypothetical protein
MFDIIAPDQHQPAAAIDCGGIDHGKRGIRPRLALEPRLPPPNRRTSQAASPISASTMTKAKEPKRLRHVLSPSNIIRIYARFAGQSPRNKRLGAN